MALRVRNWLKWQGSQVNAVKRNRKKKRHAEGAPYSMQTISICTQIERDAHFRSFAKEVGPAKALTYFVRVLIAAGVADGMKGVIDISRSEFGRWVLSTPDHRVGKKAGEKVYDALLLAHLCTEFSTGLSPVSSPGSSPASAPGREGGDSGVMGSEEMGRDPGPTDAESRASRGSASTDPKGSASPRSGGGYEQFRAAAELLAEKKAVNG